MSTRKENLDRDGIYLNSAGQLCVQIDGKTTFFNLTPQEALYLVEGLCDFALASLNGAEVQKALALYGDHAGSA